MVTAPLVLAPTILSVIVAVPLGVVAGARHRKPDGVVLSAVSQLGIALPSFWVGLMLITLFAVQRQIFPAQGFPRSGWDDPVEATGRSCCRRSPWPWPSRRSCSASCVGDARRAAPGTSARRGRRA